MNSLILRTAMRLMMPLLLLFSFFLLLRGHNNSGGGFAGGLVASAAFALYSLSYSSRTTRDILPVQPAFLIAVGLLLALLSGVVGLVLGQAFLTGVWGYFTMPGLGRIDLGTPLFFDIGVYLVVTGVLLTLIFSLEEVE
jgi:multicomponent Na+:H+ antiporter subunit B